MYKLKCPACGDTHTVKNGKRKGVQTYVCKECGFQFRNKGKISQGDLWRSYQEGKQTVSELASAYGVSDSTIKRRLREVAKKWVQPQLSGGGFVHLDATYWGYNWGVVLALDEESGKPLYLEFITHEKVQDHVDAVRSIEGRNFVIKGIVTDGMKSLFNKFGNYKIQMCQYHMIRIVRRYLTLHPKLIAAKELNALVGGMTTKRGADFEKEYMEWKTKWNETLNKRTTLKAGMKSFIHKRLRSAMHSRDFYLPYLFTYQRPECEGMPNTNNKIEGTFTELMRNLNNHSGMTKENRKRFISGFFLAL